MQFDPSKGRFKVRKRGQMAGRPVMTGALAVVIAAVLSLSAQRDKRAAGSTAEARSPQPGART